MSNATKDSSTSCSSKKLDNQLGTSLRNRLIALFTESVEKVFPDIPDCPVPLTATSNYKFGDYQCNAAMAITKLLKDQGMVRYFKI